MISESLKIAIKLSPKRAYEIAHEAGIHPSTLSKLICGIEKVREGDLRVLKVAKVLKLKESDCFENPGHK